MKFEIGKTYYGVNPGVGASDAELTVLDVVGDEPRRVAAVKVKSPSGVETLEIRREKDSTIFDGWIDAYYQDTPWRREFEAGDRIVLEYQHDGVSHYILREKFTHSRPFFDSCAYQWIALRIHKNGGTYISTLSPSDVESASPYVKK